MEYFLDFKCSFEGKKTNNLLAYNILLTLLNNNMFFPTLKLLYGKLCFITFFFGFISNNSTVLTKLISKIWDYSVITKEVRPGKKHAPSDD